MTTRWLLLLLLGALLAACGKYGPPQRVRHEPAPVVNSAEAAPAAAETDEDEKQP